MEQLFFFGGIAGGVLRRTSGSSACLKKGLFESVAACLRCVFGFGIGTGCPKQAYWCLPCRRSAFAALTRWGGKRRGLWWLGGFRQRFIGFTAHCFLERGTVLPLWYPILCSTPPLDFFHGVRGIIQKEANRSP